MDEASRGATHEDFRASDPRSNEELVRIALTEEDEDAAWKPVTVL